MGESFQFELEQFADIRILRYQVPGFDNLSLRQKKLIYYLSQSALCGRDILADQNGQYNLVLRRTLEVIFQTYTGDKSIEEWTHFVVYLKRIWFSNGIHHHYSSDKIKPNFTINYFRDLISNSNKNKFPRISARNSEETEAFLEKLIFDSDFMAQKVVQNTDIDIIINSAVNFYGEGVSQLEAEEYYSRSKLDKNQPISHGLNSRLVKENGELREKVWKLSGMYSDAIEQIIYWLQKAKDVCDSMEQETGIGILIDYYETGDLRTWDEYNVIWVKDQQSHVDYVNGFIEVYSDPMGMKATWESIVNFKDVQGTKRTKIVSDNAQWFEDNSPVDDRFKKKSVTGVSAKVITMAMLGGDCYPHTPIGINLPNSDWIRKEHGSKSVTIENITHAYTQADLNSGFLEEFSLNKEEIEQERKYGAIANNLHTDLHECLGHGSGQLLEGISSEALKNYHSPLEETRADLFALYFMMDTRMVELRLLPNLDAAKVHYRSYIRNGLMTQLKRIEPGKNIEQAHMRNRQLISSWAFEKGKERQVIKKKKIGNKTYYLVNDFFELRNLFGELLAEVQRIKSEGDYQAGKELVETYGVKVDQELHREVHERFRKLRLPAFSGFVNPEYHLVKENGEIIDVQVRQVNNYTSQMLKYSSEYSFLPDNN